MPARPMEFHNIWTVFRIKNLITSRLHEEMGTLSSRGAGGDEAISFSGKDCFAALEFSTQRVENLRTAVLIQEEEGSEVKEIGDGKSLPVPLRQPRREIFHEPLAISCPLPASLFRLHDTPADQPVGRHHVGVHTAHSQGVRICGGHWDRHRNPGKAALLLRFFVLLCRT